MVKFHTEIRKGDKVRYRHLPGPTMFVNFVDAHTGPLCQWFDKVDVFHEQFFELDDLEHVDRYRAQRPPPYLAQPSQVDLPCDVEPPNDGDDYADRAEWMHRR